MRRRRLIVLCATFALLTLAGGAGAAPSPVKRAPSLLWRSYPLKQRTAATQPRPLRPPALADGARSGSGGGIISPFLTLFALFGGASLALAGLLAKKFLKEGTARKGHSAQPARASAFTLYFILGSDELTDESKQDVDRILAEIARRPVPDVLVVGHTDAVGTDQSNDALGQQRADSMRAALIGRGIAPENVRAISRGKRALAIPTADGVAEPRNRRVEILVR